MPDNPKAMQRVIEMFAYYAYWIPNDLNKIKPLVKTKNFPLSKEASSSYKDMKKCLTDVTLRVIDDSKVFTVETDASEVAISASLNQKNKPVPFLSRTLNTNKAQHSIVEKDAIAIVEAAKR